MSEGQETREYPMDIYALQPGKGGSDPNTVAEGKTWGDGEKWWTIYNVFDLRDHIRSKCGDKFYVRFLRIGGHGNTDRFRLGSTLVSREQLRGDSGTIITSIKISELKPVLDEITPYLKHGKSLIILDHCYVGQNDLLLKELSDAFGGIPVIAPFDGQVTNEGDGVHPRLEGEARVCNTEVCFSMNPSETGLMV